MNKLIHEGRFGPPGTSKTRLVVGTYPRPLLDLSFDMNGWSVIREPVKILTVEEAIELSKKNNPAELPPISVVDFFSLNTSALTVSYSPRSDAKTFPALVGLVNQLVTSCPWKTVVLDTATGLSDAIYGHQAVTNASALADPRKWAGNIGMKVKQVIDVIHMIKAHTVIIFHSEVEQNELTKQVREMVMVYSKLREAISNAFDQFFYADVENGKAIVRTQKQGLIHGVKVRWPELPEKCEGDFKTIYGKAGL